jgi:hypothetical protein
MRYFAFCAGLAMLAPGALAAPAGAAGNPSSYVAVEFTVAAPDGVSKLRLVGRSGAEAVGTQPAGGELSATARAVLQPDGSIRLHYSLSTVEVSRRRAAGEANAATVYPQVRDLMVVDDAVLKDGATLTKQLGGGVALTVSARRLAQPPAEASHPATAQFVGAR